MTGWAVLWAGLAIGCTGYDLAISRTLVQRESAWAAFGQRFGELPGVTAFALATLALYSEPGLARRSRLARELPWLLCSVAVAVLLALSAYRLWGERLAPGALGCILAVSALATRAWRHRLAEGRPLPVRVRTACVWTVRLTISCWLLVSLLKLGWGRVRFRDLSPLGSEFTPWYAPQGWTGHASFPSGHAAVGWLLLPSLLLWSPGSDRYRCAFAASLAWGAFVAASRVVIGAHYASDVLFSSALAFALMAFAPWDTASSQRGAAGAADEPDAGK